MYIEVEVWRDMSKVKINKFGEKVWRNAAGDLHRLDGPAVVSSKGTLEWWVNGVRHRLDGPAIELTHAKVWLIHGVRYANFKDFQAAGNLTDEQMCILRLKYGEI